MRRWRVACGTSLSTSQGRHQITAKHTLTAKVSREIRRNLNGLRTSSAAFAAKPYLSFCPKLPLSDSPAEHNRRDVLVLCLVPAAWTRGPCHGIRRYSLQSSERTHRRSAPASWCAWSLLASGSIAAAIRCSSSVAAIMTITATPDSSIMLPLPRMRTSASSLMSFGVVPLATAHETPRSRRTRS